MNIGVHVCEYCGHVWDTIGRYLDCAESHVNDPGYDEWAAHFIAERDAA